MNELVALAVGLAVRCDDCIAVHTAAAIRAGTTHEKIAEIFSDAAAHAMVRTIENVPAPGGNAAKPHSMMAMSSGMRQRPTCQNGAWTGIPEWPMPGSSTTGMGAMRLVNLSQSLEISGMRQRPAAGSALTCCCRNIRRPARSQRQWKKEPRCADMATLPAARKERPRRRRTAARFTQRELAMIDFDVIAYTMLGISSSVSALQIGRWILNANPRAVIHAGRWSLAALIGLTPVVLLWLVMSGRSTLAMMLAAFALPVFVQGGLRWRALLGPLNFARGSSPRWDQDFDAPIVPSRPFRPDPMNADLVRQSVAVLRAYLAQAAGQGDRQLARTRFANGPVNGTGNGAGRRTMSAEEALDVLGLEPDAGPRQISEAHYRLQQKLKPELGDTHYLTMKIDEAREVLLLEE
jgi:AhpD family alkylhydroperoxidase